MIPTCADCGDGFSCLAIRGDSGECISADAVAWLGGCSGSGTHNGSVAYELTACPTQLRVKNNPLVLISVVCVIVIGIFVTLMIGKRHSRHTTAIA